MSGRKSWEVAGVLEEAERALADIQNSYINKIDFNTDAVAKNQEQLDDLSQKVINFKVMHSDPAKKEFSANYEQVLSKLNILKNKSDENFKTQIRALNNRKEELLNQIKQYKRKSANIRSRIQNAQHYCNQEYSEAQQIRIGLNSTLKTFRSILYDSETLKSKSNGVLISKKNRLNDINSYNQKIVDLDRRARDVIKIRNEASSLRKAIGNEFGTIDENIAIKFAPEKFSQTEKAIDKFNKLTDKEVIEQYKIISEKIFQTKSFIDEAFSKWQESKKNTEQLLNELETKIKGKEFLFMEDYINKRDNKVNLFDFLQKYDKKFSKDKFIEKFNEAKKDYIAEKFDKADNIVADLNTKWSDLYLNGQNILKRILTALNLSIKMQTIMEKFGFSTVLDTVNGNFADGFTLKCTNGDTIDFDKIMIDDDGNTIIELDHQEGTGGTCGVRWKDMQKTFQKEGVPLTDVVKNGKSVIYKDHTIINKDSNSKNRSNR